MDLARGGGRRGEKGGSIGKVQRQKKRRGRRTLLDGSVSFGPRSLAPFRSRSRNSNGFGDLCPRAYHERAACCMQIIIDAVKTLRRAADHTTQQRQGERDGGGARFLRTQNRRRDGDAAAAAALCLCTMWACPPPPRRGSRVGGRGRGQKISVAVAAPSFVRCSFVWGGKLA